MSHRANKRRRRKPPQAYTHLSSAEERFFQQAMRNSKVDTRRIDGKLEVPFAPTFYPTVEDMEGNPLDFVEKIRPQAQKYGICKIVPPAGWKPPFCKFRYWSNCWLWGYVSVGSKASPRALVPKPVYRDLVVDIIIAIALFSGVTIALSCKTYQGSDCSNRRQIHTIRGINTKLT